MEGHLYKAKTTKKENPKSIFNNVWVEGDLIISAGKYYIHPRGNAVSVEGEIGKLIVMHEVDPVTICQCTGVRDENDNLIWENDIVAFTDMYSTESGYAETNCDGQVVWDDETLSFQVTERLSAESYEVLKDCVVIGNRFDNPELMEV